MREYFELKRPIYLLCLGSFVNRAGALVVPFLAIYVEEELGLGVAFAALTMGAFGLGAFVASIVGGQLADQIGRRKVMLGSLIGSGLLLLAMAHVKSPTPILVVTFLFALLLDMYRPAASAMIADLTDESQRTAAFGLMYVAVNLGFSISPLIGGELAERSYDLLFVVDAGTAFLYAGIIAVAIRETLDSETQSDAARISPRQAFRAIGADRRFMAFILGTLVLGSVFAQAMTTLPIDLSKNLDLGPKIYGRLIAINGILIVMFQLPVTHALSRIARSKAILLGACMLPVGFGLTALATSWPLVAVTIIIWTIGEIMQAPLLPAVVSDFAPPAMRGRYMGAFSMTFTLAMTIGSPIGGLVLDQLGRVFLWTSTIGVGAAGVFLYWRIRHDLDARKDQVTPAAG